MKILIVLPWMRTINIAFMKVYLITSQPTLTFIILYHGLNSIVTAALSSIFRLIFPAYVSLHIFLSLSCNLIYFPCLFFFFSYLCTFNFTFFFYFFFLFFLFTFFIFFTFFFFFSFFSFLHFFFSSLPYLIVSVLPYGEEVW